MRFALKKQLRWLVFLLVPFLALLLIHVSVPLIFTLQNIPLLQQNYNIEEKQHQFKTIYSFHQSNYRIITTKLVKYYRVFLTLKQFISDGGMSKFLTVNLKNILINNAYELNQKIKTNNLGNGYVQLISMWFTTGCSSFDSLSPLQKSIYYSYASTQPYIRSLFNKFNRSSVASTTTMINIGGDSISFQYPSKYQQSYSDLGNPTFPEYYYKTMSNFKDNNQTISSFIQYSQNGTAFILRLCLIIFKDDFPKGVSCLNYDMIKFALQLKSIVDFVKIQYTSSNYFILIPLYQDPTSFMKIIQINQRSITILDNNTDNIIKRDSNMNSVDHTRIHMKGFVTQLFGPIIITDQDNVQNNFLYFSTQNTYKQTDISNSNNFNTNINLFLTFVIILIVIVSIISTFIIKRLMNSLDQQLIQLSNMCSFIFQDDINVDIPEYNGTKDIKDVYQEVKIINKLNKYSHYSYFCGHYADKILKYSQAMQFLCSIDYDISSVQQNLGMSYFLMEETEKSIDLFKQSVNSILSIISNDFGTIDEILQKKKLSRLSKRYKELEVILIRRLYNLIEAYNCYLQCCKTPFDKNQKITQALEYIDIFKKTVYPEYTTYAECILVVFFQCKINLENNNIEIAKKNLERAFKLSEIYIQNYPQITKKLKEKGSKYKLFHLKNKLTAHSRMNPEKIKCIRSYYKALVLLAESNLENNHLALQSLVEGTKIGIFSNRVTYMIFNKMIKLLEKFQIGLKKLQSTQIYQQVSQFRNMEQKSSHAETCPFRYASQIAKIERQFVYIIDCLGKQGSQRKNKSNYIYHKLIKKKDRVSIIKCNTSRGIKVECNLTLKQSKQQILKKQLNQSFDEQSSTKLQVNNLFEVFEKAIFRIKNLKNEKIVLIFFQKISLYVQHLSYMRKKQQSRFKRMIVLSEEQSRSYMSSQHLQFQRLGNQMINIILESGIENCKICLFCAQADSIEEFRQYFGLNELNKRLWRNWNALNEKNITFYAISNEFKHDIDRILSKKIYRMPDNHIFIL